MDSNVSAIEGKEITYDCFTLGTCKSVKECHYGKCQVVMVSSYGFPGCMHSVPNGEQCETSLVCPLSNRSSYPVIGLKVM